MKLSLLILGLFNLFIHKQDEKFPKNFQIGEYSYVMTIKKGYNHDDDVTAVYFVVNKKGNKNNQIGSHKVAEHNGQNIIIGSYRLNKRFIEFREVYSEGSSDSMIKRFYPNNKGNLILTEYIEYKDGIGKRTKL
jgi:heptaprenylglyceryl phosphate synthase